jgi:alkyl hydroperoxide reductase subunit AhpC
VASPAAVIDGDIKTISSSDTFSKGWTVLLFYPKVRRWMSCLRDSTFVAPTPD